MDILVSSNLERLLYLLTDDSRTRSYMELLSAAGGYRVEPETLAALQSQFSAGCCDDRETMETIGRVFRERGYLMDTHTAVAAKVLADYRQETGDAAPAVVVSTASPFKFAADVLTALGKPQAEDPLTALAEASGQSVPRPLRGLEERELRFPGVTERSGMKETVSAFLR